ncbi:GNAT family N-acetyltransferase [Candidatus Bipolaricaulota bacterium]|nr:GNAT family N-acetyltransferase [Candidatus Bipolaricaulota bacterium]
MKSMRMSCDPKNHARVRLFEQHELRPVRYRFTMQTQLTTPIKEPGMLSDLAIIHWTEQQSESARDAFNRAFESHWGLPAIHEDMWPQRFVGVPQFRPDLSWLVLSEHEVIGLCINWGPSMDAENALSKRGWIEAIGVVPEWRGRGVADVMMTRSLNSFLGEGLSYASLDVDTQNSTGALQLYEKHGFAPSKREAVFEKLLD